VFGLGDAGATPVSSPEVDVENGEVTDRCVEEAERRGVEGIARVLVAALSIFVLVLEYRDVVRAMRVDPVTDGVLTRRAFRGVVGTMPAEPFAGVVVALSYLYLGKLAGGAEIRLSLLNVRF
jgi:hypothetical protein